MLDITQLLTLLYYNITIKIYHIHFKNDKLSYFKYNINRYWI